MHNPTIRLFVAIAIAVAVCAAPSVALGQTPYGGGEPTPYGGKPVTVKNPLGDITFQQLLEKLLNAARIIMMPIIVLAIVYSGFKFVIARGNTGELETARRNFLYVVIGSAIFLGAFLIAQVIANTMKQFPLGP